MNSYMVCANGKCDDFKKGNANFQRNGLWWEGLGKARSAWSFNENITIKINIFHKDQNDRPYSRSINNFCDIIKINSMYFFQIIQKQTPWHLESLLAFPDFEIAVAFSKFPRWFVHTAWGPACLWPSRHSAMMASDGDISQDMELLLRFFPPWISLAASWV